MLLFRSEEHLERWRRERGIERGATLSLQQQWQLADAWYAGRLDRAWQRRSPDEAEAVFESVGLTGTFWQFT